MTEGRLIEGLTCAPGKGQKRRYLFPSTFVIHPCRHTALTRWGEAGADAFTIQKLAGHSSATIFATVRAPHLRYS